MRYILLICLLLVTSPVFGEVIKIVQVTDIHYGGSYTGDYSTAHLNTALATAANTVAGVNLLAITGDVIDNASPATAQTYINGVVSNFSNGSAALAYIPGNHDMYQSTVAQLKNNFSTAGAAGVTLVSKYATVGGFYGSFDVGGIHVVMLDPQYVGNTHIENATTGDDGGTIGSTQLAWLTADLAATTKPTVVMTHQNLYDPTGPYGTVGEGTSWSYISNSAAVIAVLNASGKVIMTMCGHSHVRGHAALAAEGAAAIDFFGALPLEEQTRAGATDYANGNNAGTFSLYTIDTTAKTIVQTIYEMSSGGNTITTQPTYAFDYADPTYIGTSNYLLWPTNGTTYNPTSGNTTGWGTTLPAIGTKVNAPTQYGSATVRRADHTQLTGDMTGGAKANSLIVYSRYTPSNTTNEFVLVHGENSTSAWVFRTSTNQPATGVGGAPLRMRPDLGTGSRSLGENNELRWDYSGNHPYRLYFVGASPIVTMQAVGSENPYMSFYYTDIDPVTGVQSTPVLIRDFSSVFPSAGTYPTGGYTNAYISNDVEGDSSIDSRYWAWMVEDSGTGGTDVPYSIFTYDMQTNTILGRLQQNCTGVSGPCTVATTPDAAQPHISAPNMVEITPAGTRVHVNWGRVYTGSRDADLNTIADGPKAFAKDFSDPIRIGEDEAHSGWAWGLNGEELFVSKNNTTDYMYAVNIASAATANCVLNYENRYNCGTNVQSLYPGIDPTYETGVHFSRMYDRNKRGWILMGISSGSTTIGWAANQYLMVEVSKAYNATPAPRVWRISPSFNYFWDYRSEGSSTLSFDGNTVWSTANFGIPLVSDVNEVFSVALPTTWYTDLGGSVAADTTAPTTTASPVAGSYTSTQTVSLSCSDDTACSSTQYCLTAACTPSTTYTAPLTIAATTTLRYRSLDAVPNTETTKQSVYTITAPVVGTASSKASGKYSFR